MGAADFLFSPEVQKLMQLVYSQPDAGFTTAEIAKACKLDAGDVERTQAHLLQCGMLVARPPAKGDADAVGANQAFVFYEELRSIALKSFAAAEPLRAMLLSKFRKSVVRAWLLGEDSQGTVELLVVHGAELPDEQAMAAACRKVSGAIGRHLQVHVISGSKFAALGAGDPLGRKLAGAALELVAAGDTKARPATEREGLFEAARKRLAALAR